MTHEHECPTCHVRFRCTAGCHATRAYACVCCKLDAISERHRSEKLTYTQYIHSPEWAARRFLAMRAANFRCVRCGTRGYLEVHHLHYETLGHEADEDLEVLCPACHEVADEERRARTRRDRFQRRYEAWVHAGSAHRWSQSRHQLPTAEDFMDWLEAQGELDEEDEAQYASWLDDDDD